MNFYLNCGKKSQRTLPPILKRGNSREEVCCIEGSTFVNYKKYLAIYTSAKEGVQVLWNGLMHPLNMKKKSVPSPHRHTLQHTNNSQSFTTLVNHYLINFSLKKQENPKLWKITHFRFLCIYYDESNRSLIKYHTLSHEIFPTKSRLTCSMFVMRCICSNISSLVV